MHLGCKGMENVANTSKIMLQKEHSYVDYAIGSKKKKKDNSKAAPCLAFPHS